MINEKGMIMCPRPRGLAPIQINLMKIKQIEARIEEIAYLTPKKAPELLAIFNKAHVDLSEYMCSLDNERNKAERDARVRRSVIMLDEIPKILKEKGLATDRSPGGSADTRQAIIDIDPHYQSALEIVEQITCVMKLLKDKRDGLEMAYHSIKRLIDSRSEFGVTKMTATTDNNLDAGQTDPGDVNWFGTPR